MAVTLWKAAAALALTAAALLLFGCSEARRIIRPPVFELETVV